MFDELLPSRRLASGSEGVEADLYGPPQELESNSLRWDFAAADQSAGDPTLVALCLFVSDRLPWRSRLDKEPVQMKVLEAGYLNHPYRDFRPGTPYVNVGVANWDAAAAVRSALEPIARLSEAAWKVGWGFHTDAFRSIRIFPRLDDAL
jgi:hypothetical protein